MRDTIRQPPRARWHSRELPTGHSRNPSSRRPRRTGILQYFPDPGSGGAIKADLNDRNHNRLRLRGAIVNTGATSIGARVAATIVSFAIVPMGFSAFGPERFGVWLTVASFFQLTMFLDLGVGNGLITAISSEPEPRGRNTVEWISSGLVLLVGSAAAAALIGVTLGFTVNWASVFETEITGEIAAVLIITSLALTLGLPSSITEKLQWGLQLGHISSAWQIVASATTLIGAVAVTNNGGNLAAYCAVVVVPPLAAALFNGTLTFTRRFPDLRPSLRSVTKTRIMELSRMGGFFLGIQLIGGIAFASDNLILTQTLGVESVPSLALPAKLFGAISMMTGAALLPLWPAYGLALARNDAEWVRSVFRKSLLASTSIGVAGGLIGVWLGPSIISWWIGPEFPVVDRSLLIALAVWTVVLNGGTAVAMLLNSARVFRFQLVAGSLMVVAMITTKVKFANEFGITGLPWAATVAYGLVVLVPSLTYTQRLLARLGS